MKAEQQYIDLFTHYEDLICRHAAGLMNLPRAEDRKSTRLNSSHMPKSRMPSSA